MEYELLETEDCGGGAWPGTGGWLLPETEQ